MASPVEVLALGQERTQGLGEQTDRLAGLEDTGQRVRAGRAGKAEAAGVPVAEQ